MSASIFSITAEQIETAIAAAESRAKARLCAGEGADIVIRIKEAAEVAKAAGLPVEKIEVYSDGGAVPNSYNKGMGGDATKVYVSASGVRAYRSAARKVAGGGSGVRRCYIQAGGPDDPNRALAKAAGLNLNSLGQILLVVG